MKADPEKPTGELLPPPERSVRRVSGRTRNCIIQPQPTLGNKEDTCLTTSRAAGGGVNSLLTSRFSQRRLRSAFGIQGEKEWLRTALRTLNTSIAIRSSSRWIYEAPLMGCLRGAHESKRMRTFRRTLQKFDDFDNRRRYLDSERRVALSHRLT